jgi:hypothetical protein
MLVFIRDKVGLQAISHDLFAAPCGDELGV